MRAKTLQIVWHGKDQPVFSLDFHPNGNLITGGGDKELKVWQVGVGEDGYATVEHQCSLSGHQKSVNCVRVSPTGGCLVSCGDEKEMLLWQPVGEGEVVPRGLGDDEEEGQPTWRRMPAPQLGKQHSDDVLDVAWAPDGTALASTSIDNRVLVSGVHGKRPGEVLAPLANHKHFVQGAAWDPAQQYLVTQGADRTCRVYSLREAGAGRKTKISQYLLPAADTARELYCSHVLSKRATADGAKHPLFLDESMNSFFRRLAWSPEGSFLAVPAGLYKATGEGKQLNTVYVYGRGRWSAPIMHLPGHSKPAVAVRFCPVLFERDDKQTAAAPAAAEQAPEGGEAPPPHPFDLPYKMVFAVATVDSVVLYDTQSVLPLAVLGQLHYDAITDLAWSSDGRFLAVSSRDCYCSIAAFDPLELGRPLGQEKLPPHIAKRMAAAQRLTEETSAGAAAGAPGGGAAAGAGTPGASLKAAPAAAASGQAAAPTASKPVDTPRLAAAGGVAGGVQGTVEKRAVSAQAPLQQQQPAAAAPEPASQAKAAPPPHKKRIQPELVAAPASGAAAGDPQEQPAAKKPKRIVPEAVGPAPAVVGDSQQAEPVKHSEPPGPASGGAQPRRIVPEAIGGASAGGGASNPERKRVVPTLLAPAPSATAHPAESALSSAVAGSSAKAGGKRITPTPLRTGAAATTEHFGSAAKQAAHPVQTEHSRDGTAAAAPPPSTGRRIVPTPIGAAASLPQGVDVPPSSAPRSSKMNIAAMALAAGKSAAMQSKQE